MGYGYLVTLSPVICLAINVFSQIVTFRYFPAMGLLNSILIGFIAGFFGLFLFGFNTAAAAWQIVTYAALGYCYFHFINLGETARRIRILRELNDAPAGLSLNELLECYNAKEILERRILRLEKNGQIVLKDGKYYIGKPEVLLMAKAIVALKLIFLGKRSEFD